MVRLSQPQPASIRVPAIIIALVTLLAACGVAPAPSGGPAPSGQPGAVSSAPKRIKAVVRSSPATVSDKLNGGQAKVFGLLMIEYLLNDGLGTLDSAGNLRAALAEQIPTVENGLWTVFPDGRMETIWKLRSHARWHDGVPFTSDDILFTSRLEQDRDMPVSRDIAYEFVETVEAPDPRTLTIRWKQGYVGANDLFRQPVPSHVMERTFLENKLAVLDHPYWREEFVGTGPFRLKEYALGSHALLQANDAYYLGRPKVDEIEVRFIPDDNTVMANILAGEVDLTLERTLSVDQAIDTRDLWREGGRVEVATEAWFLIFPQLLASRVNPAVVADVRFRRALLHAIDRDQIAEIQQRGLSPAAHVYVSPREPEYEQVASRIVRYNYDPQRASQLLEQLGLVRGTDGAYRDLAGQRLAVEIRTITADSNQKAVLAVSDFWQRAGLTVDPVIIPVQRSQDREYRASYPGFMLERQPNRTNEVARYHSSQTPTAENRYSGTWRPGYKNEQFDSLIERFVTTIPVPERMQVLGEIVHHMTDQLIIMGLFYDATPAMISSRMEHVILAGNSLDLTWNAHEWDVKNERR